MIRPKITINDKENGKDNIREVEMKKINIGEWLEMAKIYDKIEQEENSDVEFVDLHCKMIQVAYGLTEEEVKNLPAEDILPIYFGITKVSQELLTSKLDEKKTETEIPAKN